LNVEQVSTPGALDVDFTHTERGATVGRNALLESGFATDHATKPNGKMDQELVDTLEW
jgi:hypothetical protein